MQEGPAHRKLGIVSLARDRQDVLEDGASAMGYLTTTGRVSGRPHTVPLRLVYHKGVFYASRRDAASDRCRNLINNPNVTMQVLGMEIPAQARLVDDDRLAGTISSLKYQDERASRKRVVVEIVPSGSAPGWVTNG